MPALLILTIALAPQLELMLRDDGDRWSFLGDFCCGVDPWQLRWRQALDGGYDGAMAALRSALAQRSSPGER